MDGNALSDSNEPSSQFNGLSSKGDEQLANGRPTGDQQSDHSRSEGDDYQSESSKSNDATPKVDVQELPVQGELLLHDVRSEHADDDQKSSDQLANGLHVAGRQPPDDESSAYESLNEASSFTLENDKEEANTAKSDQQESNQTEASQEETEFVEICGNAGLLKRIIKKGDEAALKPERGCEVSINLEARNQETGELIESECEQNLSILVGDFDVIHGVDLALSTMCKGEVAEVLVKPANGYGALGRLPDIPANCTLLCRVELLTITFPNEMVCASSDALTHYLQMTKRKKERGNLYFKRQEFTIALHCYVKSGEILDFLGQEMVNRHHMLTDCQSKLSDEERKREITDELNQINELSVQYMKVKLDVFNNLAWVSSKMKLYNQALNYVNSALNIEPTDKKALYRKSVILAENGSVREAVHLLEGALKIHENSKMFRDELSKLKVKLKKEIKEEKALYAKMLQTGKKKTRKEKQSDQRWKYLTAGLVVGGVVLGGVILYRKLAKS